MAKVLSRRAFLTATALMGLGASAHAQGIRNPFSTTEEVIDYREEMRQFVQNIGGFARRFNPKFVVLAGEGVELVGKINPEDDTQVYPARAYIRSVDGFLENKLIGRLDLPPGTDPNKEDPLLKILRERLASYVKTSKMMGLRIFDMEYADTPSAIDAKYNDITKRGFVPFVASSEFLGEIPSYPQYAYNANPESLSGVNDAENFLYVRNSQGFGTTNQYVQAIAQTNHDVMITNVFHGRTPLSRLDIERMKYKKLGSRRLVLAEMDISTAATYHYYWQPQWEAGNPEFISLPLREDPDLYRVQYWHPGWQSVISGGASSFLYGIIDLGFDGVVLKGTDAWRFFETGGEQDLL